MKEITPYRNHIVLDPATQQPRYTHYNEPPPGPTNTIAIDQTRDNIAARNTARVYEKGLLQTRLTN